MPPAWLLQLLHNTRRNALQESSSRLPACLLACLVVMMGNQSAYPSLAWRARGGGIKPTRIPILAMQRHRSARSDVIISASDHIVFIFCVDLKKKKKAFSFKSCQLTDLNRICSKTEQQKLYLLFSCAKAAPRTRYRQCNYNNKPFTL